MRVNVIGSSSLGNCYVLQNENEALVIECGCKIDDVFEAINFNLRKVRGAIVTHSHNDHAGFIKQYLDMGIRTLALDDVFTSHSLKGNPFSETLEVDKTYKFGNFVVQPVKAYHDAECVGYIIYHPECGKILFATDTYRFPYKFRDLAHIMIEANYIQEIVDRKVEAGTMEYFVARRLAKSHMEFGTTLSFLAHQDLSKTETIILIHLSYDNSNADYMVNETRRRTGKPVVEAETGVVVELNY